MQTTINVDLPDYDDAGELVSSVDRLVGRHIVESIRQEAKDDVRKVMVERVATDVEAIIREAITEPTTPMSIYGERKGEPMTLKERIIEMAQKYLEEKVDSNGRRSSGSKTFSRVEWILRTAVDDAVAVEVAALHTQIRAEAVAAMTKWLAEKPGD